MKTRLFPSIFLLAALLFLPSLTLLGEDRHILEGEYERVKSDSLFLVGGDWLPFPDYSDRQGWDVMLGHSKGILVRAGEKYLDYQWQIVPATAYLAYERTGERKIMEDPVSVIIDIDGEEYEIPKRNIQDISLAYACTVHKSQGSE